MMKRGYVKIILLSVFIILIQFLLIAQEIPVTFDKNKVETWTPENIKLVLSLDRQERNTIVKAAAPTLREKVMENIGLELSKRTIQKRTDIYRVAAATAKLLGRPFTIPEHLDVLLENLNGFNNPSLQFRGNTNIITDGAIELDFDKLPIGATEIDYDLVKGFTFHFKNGGEASIQKGTLHEDLTYISPAFTDSQKSPISFTPGTGSISVDKDDNFVIKGNALVKIGDRSFSKLSKEEGGGDGPGEVRIVGAEYFKGKNLKILNSEFSIKTSPNKETDIIFGVGEYPALTQYVQIYGDKFKGVIMRGENLQVELLKEGLENKNVDVDLKGINLIVKNGDMTWEGLGERMLVNRKGTVSNVDMELINNAKPQQTIVTTLQTPAVEEGTPVNSPGTTFPPVQTQSITQVKKDDTSRVCIGRFCTYGNLNTWAGGEPYEVPAGYKGGLTESLILDNGVFAPASDVEAFKSLIKQNNWDNNQIRQEAATFFNDVQSHLLVRYELPWTKIEGRITKMTSGLGLNPHEQFLVNDFKFKVSRLLTQGKVPVGTKVVIASKFTGKEDSSFGSFVVALPGKKSINLVLPGIKFDKEKQKNFREGKYQVSELLK